MSGGSSRPVLRFAPSPNGRLHLGHAYSALLNAEVAAALGGTWLLRLEDIDPGRSRAEFEHGITEDLAWLGLAWPQPVRRQSEHGDDYRRASASLRDMGLLYPCFCTRRDIAAAVRRGGEGESYPTDPDGAPLYPSSCRPMPKAEAEQRICAGEPHAWRIDMASALNRAPGPHRIDTFEQCGARASVAVTPGRWGDAVIVRKDFPTSYHLAVVVDDGLQGVTHVVRGVDLEAATSLHVLLQSLLGIGSPIYHHHRLVRDEIGAKLSKSQGSRSLRDLRDAGVTAADIRRSLGF